MSKNRANGGRGGNSTPRWRSLPAVRAGGRRDLKRRSQRNTASSALRSRPILSSAPLDDTLLPLLTTNYYYYYYYYYYDYYYGMLEQFLIFTKGGLILFQSGASKLSGEPVANLVQNILLEVQDAPFATIPFPLPSTRHNLSYDTPLLLWNSDSNLCLTIPRVRQNRGGDSSFSHDKYTVEWLLLNEHDLIFVVRHSSFG